MCKTRVIWSPFLYTRQEKFLLNIMWKNCFTCSPITSEKKAINPLFSNIKKVIFQKKNLIAFPRFLKNNHVQTLWLKCWRRIPFGFSQHVSYENKSRMPSSSSIYLLSSSPHIIKFITLLVQRMYHLEDSQLGGFPHYTFLFFGAWI